MNNKIIIAIDGPAGSGKTTTAKNLAERLNYLYIDTGGMYRAVTLYWIRMGKPDFTEFSEQLQEINIELKRFDDGLRYFLNGEDVSEEIRSIEVAKTVAIVSANADIREKLVKEQRKIGAMGGVAMDGRDIGTVVFPHAELKVFLNASIDARAKRRALEMESKGIAVNLDELQKDIEERDRIDREREVGPLKQAEDAIAIDTSNMTIDEQTDLIYKLALEKAEDTKNKIKIRVDPNAGFCWGVVRTVNIADETLKNREKVAVLGEIIHNPKEIERLENKGLKTESVDSLKELAQKQYTAIIRAHGEPPDTYKKAQELNLEIIDATCPLVSSFQKRVKKYYELGYQIVIFGKKDHPEVIGIRGYCDDTCIVVKSVEDAKSALDFNKKTALFSQTTMDKATFKEINDFLAETYKAHNTEYLSKDTICYHVSGREESLIEFAKQNDVVLFVAGRSSSNGKSLFAVCQKGNPETYFIEDFGEIDFSWLKSSKSIGITGATSSPLWHLEEVKFLLEEKLNNFSN